MFIELNYHLATEQRLPHALQSYCESVNVICNELCLPFACRLICHTLIIK